MVETLLLIMVFGVIVVGSAIGVRKWMEYSRLKRFEEEVEFVIEEYRGRANESNRFLISEEWLTKAFPEYSREDAREIWKRIVARRLVDRDPMDSELCIRK